MSKLVLYDIPPSKYSELKGLVNFLPDDLKQSYYQYRICYYQLQLDLPLELWNEIIYLLCEIRSNIIPDNKILDWFDQYIHDPRQHKLNPVLMDTTTGSLYTGYLRADGVNISYKPVSIRLEGPDCFYHTRILYYADLMVGIIQDDRIKSIKFTMDGKSIIYQVNDLYEYTFKRAYSHTIEQVSQTNITTTTGFHPDIKLLLDPKYLNKENIKFWSVDIMPFSMANCPFTEIFMEIETNEPMTDIKLLYAFLSPELRISVGNNPINYKNLEYNSEIIMVK